MPVAQLFNVDAENQSVLFKCPGCGFLHAIHVKGPARPTWTWNGSLDAPTFQPSVAVHWTEHGIAKVCHSFVTDGRIQFLGDCTHALAGQTVPILAMED